MAVGGRWEDGGPRRCLLVAAPRWCAIEIGLNTACQPGISGVTKCNLDPRAPPNYQLGPTPGPPRNRAATAPTFCASFRFSPGPRHLLRSNKQTKTQPT